MAFSSHVPIYLDPPNFQQHHQGNGSGNPNQQQLSPIPPPTHVGFGGPGPVPCTIRPSSMADRARLAKIHQQEVALKCPRCGSSNTKFCYYNNYNLSQPRHFCKACRRYWTAGGALRSVPVGGGCRRKNKKNKRNASTSSESPPEKQVGNASNSKHSTGNEIAGGLIPQQTPHLPFMGSLQSSSQFGLGNLGLHFGGIQGETSGGTQQQNLQYPLFDPSNGLYPFQSVEGSSSISPSSRVSQLAPMKMLELKSRPQYLGGSENKIQYWGGNSWTNLSGDLNSSNTINHLL